MGFHALKKLGRPALCSLAIAVGGLGLVTSAQADSYKLGKKTYRAVGEVKADFDGERAQWVVFDQHPLGKIDGSAFWTKETAEMPSQEQMAEQMKQLMGNENMSDQQKEQMAAAMQLMEQLGPLFEGMGKLGISMDGVLDQAFGGQFLDIDITAYDVKADDPLDQGILKIHATLPGDTELKAENIEAIDTDIYYIVEGGNTMFLPKLAYWSDEDYDGEPAQISFKKIDLNPDGTGEIQGYFKANLCRWEREKMMQGMDHDDCKTIEGAFETPIAFLAEED